MAFDVTPLLTGGVRVRGTDRWGESGRTQLQSDKWDLYQAQLQHKELSAEYKTLVDTTFGPFLDFAEKAKAAQAKPGGEYRTVSIQAGVEGVDAIDVELDDTGVLLRLLAEGKHDLLEWLDDHTLVAILS